ncbi:S-adenosyl-L-methionine-dependent methyltransferase [Cubamyces lactineus]|nr:S-adenosyl-L-methionine-dependent methyltransferase [Cubamyces lactineus]
MPNVKATTVSAGDPQAYEDAHVHAVYDEIAPHFSSTRYKPWPIIAAFLSSLPPGAVGVDLGTGNGKYLPLPADRPGSVWTVGLDRSRNLLEIARRAGGALREVVWGDVLGRPWRIGAFDYAISIATIHHLATPARRKAAVKRLLECISPSHGRALIYVWAIEQDELSKRSIPVDAGSPLPPQPDARGTPSPSPSAEGGKGQDVFVPWVLAQPQEPKPKGRRKGKLGERSAGEATPPSEAQSDATTPKVFDRYYHMFAKGELNELVTEAAVEMGLRVGEPGLAGEGVQIVQDGWERSNYYVELRRWKL